MCCVLGCSFFSSDLIVDTHFAENLVVLAEFREWLGIRTHPFFPVALCTWRRPKGVSASTVSVSLATPSACYSGPKPQNSQKREREGAKGVLSPGSKGLPRVFCTASLHWCNSLCISARGLWRPWPKRAFAPSPNHFWVF